MPNLRIANYLKDHHVPYEIIKHKPVYTAQEIAAEAHIPGDSLLKVVILKMDNKLIMLLESANKKIDMEDFAKRLGATRVELAHEYEFEEIFPECDVGAMPPFGDLFNIDVYIDDAIGNQEEIAFNAGNHSELIRMRFSDFERLVKPKHIRIH